MPVSEGAAVPPKAQCKRGRPKKVVTAQTQTQKSKDKTRARKRRVAEAIVDSATRGQSGLANKRKRGSRELIEESSLDTSEDEGGAIGKEELGKLIVDREAMRRGKTLNAYATHVGKWEFYCHRDDAGNLRRKALDGDLTTSAGQGNAARFLLWVAGGCKGWKAKRGRTRTGDLTRSTLDGSHSALQSVYAKQRAMACASGEKTEQQLPRRLIEYAQYELQLATLKASTAARGERGDQDPQANTAEETYDMEQLLDLAMMVMQKGDLNNSREWTMLVWSHMTVGRGDDIRGFYLADIVKPRQMLCIGPTPCFVLPIVEHGGKTVADGKVTYAGCVRHKEPLLCAQRALAYLLCGRFTLGGASFPDPRSEEAWRSCALFPGSDQTKNVTYSTQATNLKALFHEAEIYIRKVTHAGRVGGAADLDQCGVDDSVIARVGKWMYDAMHKSYLKFFKPEALMAISKWPHAHRKDFGFYWAERFHAEIPMELVDHVFSWLPGLREAVKELGENAAASMRSVLAACEYLAIVLVQDAMELHGAYPDHPVHKHLSDNQAFGPTLALYQDLKRGNKFEAYKPRTTKEIAANTHNVLMDMCEVMLSGKPTTMWGSLLTRRRMGPDTSSAERLANEESRAAEALTSLLDTIEAGGVPSVDTDEGTDEDEEAVTPGQQQRQPPHAQQQRQQGRQQGSTAPTLLSPTTAAARFPGVYVAPEGAVGGHLQQHAMPAPHAYMAPYQNMLPAFSQTAMASSDQFTAPAGWLSCPMPQSAVYQPMAGAWQQRMQPIGPQQQQQAMQPQWLQQQQFMQQQGMWQQQQAMQQQAMWQQQTMQQQTMWHQQQAVQQQTMWQQQQLGATVSSGQASDAFVRAAAASADHAAAASVAATAAAEAATAAATVVAPKQKHQKQFNAQRSIPTLSNFTSVFQLWQRFEVGDTMTGLPPLRNYMEGNSRSGWRPSEMVVWTHIKDLITHIDEQAASSGQTAEQVVQAMDAERTKPVPSFVEHMYRQRQPMRAQAAAAAGRKLGGRPRKAG